MRCRKKVNDALSVCTYPGSGSGIVFPLDVGQTLLIGRNPQPLNHPWPLPDICLLSSAVSRRHCEVGRDPCGACLRDLNSRNGTELNGQRLSPQVVYRLQPEDRIQLPNTLLRLLVTPVVVDPAW